MVAEGSGLKAGRGRGKQKVVGKQDLLTPCRSRHKAEAAPLSVCPPPCPFTCALAAAKGRKLVKRTAQVACLGGVFNLLC